MKTAGGSSLEAVILKKVVMSAIHQLIEPFSPSRSYETSILMLSIKEGLILSRATLSSSSAAKISPLLRRFALGNYFLLTSLKMGTQHY